MKRMTQTAILLAMALGLSFAERWFSLSFFVPLPGIKLGIANIVTLFALLYVGMGEAFTIVVLRCLLSSLLYGGITGLAFSLTGGLLAMVVMRLCRKGLGSLFSIAGISIAGAAAHNIGQITAASVLMGSTAVFGYLPVLLVAAVVTGAITGTLSLLLFTRLERIRLVTLIK